MVELKDINLEDIIKFFGIHNKCNLPSFILPNGKMLNITDYYQRERSTHDDSLGKYHPALNRYQFQHATGSIRYFPQPENINISLDIKNKITKEQEETLEKCACFKKDKDIIYDFYKKYDEDAYAIVNAGGTLDQRDCFDGVKKLKRDLKIIQERYNI